MTSWKTFCVVVLLFVAPTFARKNVTHDMKEIISDEDEGTGFDWKLLASVVGVIVIFALIVAYFDKIKSCCCTPACRSEWGCETAEDVSTTRSTSRIQLFSTPQNSFTKLIRYCVSVEKAKHRTSPMKI